MIIKVYKVNDELFNIRYDVDWSGNYRYFVQYTVALAPVDADWITFMTFDSQTDAEKFLDSYTQHLKNLQLKNR